MTMPLYAARSLSRRQFVAFAAGSERNISSSSSIIIPLRVCAPLALTCLVFFSVRQARKVGHCKAKRVHLHCASYLRLGEHNASLVLGVLAGRACYGNNCDSTRLLRGAITIENVALSCGTARIAFGRAAHSSSVGAAAAATAAVAVAAHKWMTECNNDIDYGRDCDYCSCCRWMRDESADEAKEKGFPLVVAVAVVVAVVVAVADKLSRLVDCTPTRRSQGRYGSCAMGRVWPPGRQMEPQQVIAGRESSPDNNISHMQLKC